MLMDIYSLCNLAVSGTISLLDSFLEIREPFNYSTSVPRDYTEPQSVRYPVKRRTRRRIVKLQVKSSGRIESKTKLCRGENTNSVLISSPLEQNNSRFISLYSASRQNQSKRSSFRTRRKVRLLETILEEEPMIKHAEISRWQSRISSDIHDYDFGKVRD